MKYKIIFFDLDDTLIDTIQNSREALRQVYNDFNFSKYYPDYLEFQDIYTKHNIKLWDLYEQNIISKETLKSDRFINPLKEFKSITIKEALEINDIFMNLVSEKNNIIKGATDILEYLYPKYPMFILSNGFEEVQSKKMKNAGIYKYFQKIILSDHIGKNKPHPSIFEHALKEANATIESSIMIGDNIKTDIIGAKNIGMNQIWYNPNLEVDQTDINPTFIIDKLILLKEIL